MEKEKVLIIGAGPAGLSAAYKLLTEHPDKYDVTIFESSESIGGISQTIQYKGNRLDIGGHRFFTKNKEVLKCWNDIMPIQGSPAKDYRDLGITQTCPQGPNPDEIDNVFLIRNRISRIYFLKKFFDYPITINIRTILNLGVVNTIRAGIGYLHSLFFKKAESNLENFMINRFGPPLYQMFFEDYTQKLWGRHPKEIAASWGAQRIKGLSLKSAILTALHLTKEKETSLIEEFYYPKYGPGQFYEALAEKIKELGGEIRFHSHVSSVQLNEGRILSIGTNDGTIHPGNHIISSMPIKDLVTAFKQPHSIHDKKFREIAEGLPYRDFITVGVLVKKMKLKNSTKTPTIMNRIPDNWLYVQERHVSLGRIQIFNNWSPYMVQDNENTVWMGLEYFCTEGDDMWCLSSAAFIERALNELISMGIIEKSDVLDTFYKKVPKAYPAYFDTYSEMDSLKDYLNSIDNLLCIGRNGQHRYNNMDHSMLTGFEAARYINGEITDKNILWKVNTEENYHESN